MDWATILVAAINVIGTSLKCFEVWMRSMEHKDFVESLQLEIRAAIKSIDQCTLPQQKLLLSSFKEQLTQADETVNVSALQLCSTETKIKSDTFFLECRFDYSFSRLLSLSRASVSL
jgi:hypothetical protein